MEHDTLILIFKVHTRKALKNRIRLLSKGVLNTEVCLYISKLFSPTNSPAQSSR